MSKVKRIKRRSVWVVPYCEVTGRVLIAKRAKSSRNSGQWDFFGGGLEKGEDALEAARRELYEEAGLKLPRSAFEYIGKVILKTKTKLYRMDYFKVDVAKEFKPRLNSEHSRARWRDFSGKSFDNPHHSIRGFRPYRKVVKVHKKKVHAKLKTSPVRMETRNV